MQLSPALAALLAISVRLSQVQAVPISLGKLPTSYCNPMNS